MRLSATLTLPDTDAPEGVLLASVPPALRTRVQALLTSPRKGGRGLRAWLALLEADGRELPAVLPRQLIEVYLTDDEAEPLHDCESCGLWVPVRCGRRVGLEPVAERVYFPTCPHCGGKTGRFAYWSRTPERN